ncbi:pre-mRNA-splicing factor spp2 [Arthroderma uncinatum]|uniref:pre-mRNA-splicing factor spp2 n=1 Tax=Arthroderma uncinatum TaxID=74035 RepID=UPI00144AC6FA|nr:pre-mRNA-splicing factor spp2 [Arthroderma uncinatum]KAF3481649.1 pre-mRNA-splicing factor spp2 [Arthroderma uncinatum]
MPSGSSEAGSKPKPFSIALSSDSSRRSTPTPSSQKPAPFGTRNLSSRTRKFGDHDSGSEDEAEPVPEEVTGFDHQAGGAIITNKRVKTEKQPLIIKVETRNKWRDKLQAQTQTARRSLLPAEVQAQRQREANGTTDSTTEVEAPEVKFGLSYAEPSSDVVTGPAPQGHSGNGENGEHTVEQVSTTAEGSEVKPLSQDEVALQALIRESKGEQAESKRSDLVITARPKDRKPSSAYDETKSFRRDIDSRPAPASLSAYNAVPVEEFGAALLRGMGWKEGQPVGRGNYGDTELTPRVPERRAGYHGIGAKDISGKGGDAEVELGAWGKAAMRKARNDGEGLYTPVLMKSKKTGELITEDEFKDLSTKAKEKEGADDWRERRDRNLLKSGRDTEKDRDRRRDFDRDDYDDDQSSRDYRRRTESGSSTDRDRDRDRGKDRDRPRKRHYDDRLDRDSDREKDRSSSRHHRDRDRHRDREHKSTRDREDDRSRGSDSGRDRTRDRDRDRDRDQDRDRRRDYERSNR